MPDEDFQMLRLPKLNPRRNPSIRWTEQTPTALSPKGLKFERTDALRIPQITITHPRLGSGPAGTGMFQGYVEGHTIKPRRGAPRVEYMAWFNLFLPYQVAAHRANFEDLEQARVGFSPARIFAEDPHYWNTEGQMGLGAMARSGQEDAARAYALEEGALAMIDDGSEFATLEEAKAWIQSKVDTLSRLTLERPSGY